MVDLVGGDDLADRHYIACNYLCTTSIAPRGGLAYVIPQLGGNLPERLRVVVRSRGGRWVDKWEDIRRLGNFRLKTIPPEHPRWSDDRLWSASPDQLAHVIEAASERA